MKKILTGLMLITLFLSAKAYAEELIKLPEPEIKGGAPFNEVINTRRSIRDYQELPLSLKEISQLAWSAQGITEPNTGHRSAPSAVASYPLKLYLVVKENGVSDLPAGVYLYQPESHSLKVIKKGNFYPELLKAMPFFNKWVSQTNVTFIFTGSANYLTTILGETGWSYVILEAGMASENLLLSAVSMGLGACPVGGFSDKKTSNLLGIEKGAKTLLLAPVGKK